MIQNTSWSVNTISQPTGPCRGDFTRLTHTRGYFPRLHLFTIVDVPYSFRLKTKTMQLYGGCLLSLTALNIDPLIVTVSGSDFPKLIISPDVDFTRLCDARSFLLLPQALLTVSQLWSDCRTGQRQVSRIVEEPRRNLKAEIARLLE